MSETDEKEQKPETATNNPETQEHAPPPDEGLMEMGFFDTIKWALIAGFAFAAMAGGKEQLERFGRWIDGEVYTAPISSAVLDEATLLGAHPVAITGDNLRLGDFRFSVPSHWLKMESDSLRYARYIDPNHTGLLPLSLRFFSYGIPANQKLPFLLSTPKAYTVSLPKQGGIIHAFHQRVFFVNPNDKRMVIPIFKKQDAANPDIDIIKISPNAKASFSGDGDIDFTNSDDVFDMALLTQIRRPFQLKHQKYPIKIKRLRRTQIGEHMIAEIDYDYTIKFNKRLSAVLYWHHKDGNPWGDLGIFFVGLNEKTAVESKRAIKKMYASFHIQNGDHEVFRDLNYDMKADASLMPFVHVDVNALRLSAHGDFSMQDVEDVLKAKLPLMSSDVQHIELAVRNNSKLLLRDIAMVTPLTHGVQGKLDFNNVILTTAAPR